MMEEDQIFEERNEETRYGPYRMAIEPQKWVTFESEHYELNLKLRFLEEFSS
jgi:hypothetical protein